MPLSRFVWTKPLWRRRLAGWGGASTARTNRWRRCHWRKRCWPIAVNIRWSAASGGSKDARCRSRPCMYSAMTMPQDSFVCCQSRCGDGSSFAIHDGLREVFPGRFKVVKPAAVELHTTMDLLCDAPTTVVLTPDTAYEQAFL